MKTIIISISKDLREKYDSDIIMKELARQFDGRGGGKKKKGSGQAVFSDNINLDDVYNKFYFIMDNYDLLIQKLKEEEKVNDVGHNPA